jgi:putative ABC transport system substrate-binding protein
MRGTALILALALLFALAILRAPLATEAQQGGKRWRVGYLAGSLGPSPLREDFRATLQDLGYREGQNLVLESRFAEGKLERLPRLAAELVGLELDVLVVTGTAETFAAKRATTTIPIVMVVVPDPVALGLVTSLARPGGNLTGLTSTPGPGLYGKRLELLRELVPGVARIGLLANRSVPATAGRVRSTEEAARTVGVQVQIVEVRDRDELSSAFSRMKQQHLQALLVPSDPLFTSERVRLAELAAQARLPVLYDVREHVEAGGLAAYGPSFSDLFRRAAWYVDQILKGRKPSDLAVEQPRRFEFIVNLKTAKALGLTLSPTLLFQADEVLQ